MYDGNPGEIDFGSSYREVRVSEGSSYGESTVLELRLLQNPEKVVKNRIDCVITGEKNAHFCILIFS